VASEESVPPVTTGGATGVMLFDADEADEVPLALVAVTVNV
jgi:hypothetical protein